MNPFQENSLGQTAADFAAQFPNIKGQNMKRLIEEAIVQWKRLLGEEGVKGRTQLPLQFTDFLEDTPSQPKI